MTSANNGVSAEGHTSRSVAVGSLFDGVKRRVRACIMCTESSGISA
jgi:hypothetical protein